MNIMKTHETKFSMLLPFHFVLLTALAALSAPAGTLYVNVNNAAPSPPYTTWATAATNIQDAVDIAVAGDEVVVTNGIYQAGQTPWPQAAKSATNRLAVTKPLTVHSVNGSEVTIIDGGGKVRCVYLAANATLTGFTLTNGFASYSTGGLGVKGGGLYCESNSAAVFDCVITGNTVGTSGGPGLEIGAGAYGGTLTRCTLTLNTAILATAGGAAYATLNNCVIASNRSSIYNGAGAFQCTLNNCSLVWNGAYYGGGAADCT